MSQYERLPVYKAALDMAKYFEKVVEGFTRYQKYTLGTDLRELARSVLYLVAAANRRDDRINNLRYAIKKLEELKITIHLCREVKAFRSDKNVEFSIKQVEDVSRQCEGWLRSTRILSASSPQKGVDSQSLGTHSTHRV